jgi:hypothetical protein
MSRESNDAFEAYAAREGYKPGTWTYIRAQRAWHAAIAYAESAQAASDLTAPEKGQPPGPVRQFFADVHDAMKNGHTAATLPPAPPGVGACGFFDCPGCDACKRVSGGASE